MSRSVVFHKDMTYHLQRVLDKCVVAVFPEHDSEECTYELLICSGDHILVDNEDGIEEQTSKARFYCVWKFTCPGNASIIILFSTNFV